MHNFVYYNPAKILFGKNRIAQLGDEAKQYGNKALLVYGQGSIKKYGIYHQAVESLQRSGVAWAELPGVSANPVLADVYRGISVFKDSGCTYIIGVGGGSVIDTAKSISAGVCAAFDIWKLFTGKKSVKEAVPILSVPTIAGSGSETNNGIVLTNEEKGLKLGFGHRTLIPKVCISDPVTTYTVSANQTAFGSVDILSHCLEAYFSTESFDDSLQINGLESICRTVLTSTPRVLVDPESYQDRSNLLWAASLALNSSLTAGLGKTAFPVHLVSHSISAYHSVAHGAALAAVFPGWLKYNLQSVGPRLAQFGEHVFNLNGGSTHYKARRTLDLIEQWLLSINCSIRLQDLGISETHFGPMVEHCLIQARIWRMKGYNHHKLIRLLRQCY